MKKSMLVLICVLLCMFAFTAGVTAESILPDVLPDSNIPSGGIQLFNADPDDETTYSENAVTVKLAFYNCETNRFVVMPMTVTVEPKVAEKYGVNYDATTSGFDTGYTVGDTDVTVADALCAAHEKFYGDDFSPETMGQYIMSDEFFSYVMKIFEVQTQNGISFYVNGEIPMAYNSDANYWFGYAINQCILEDGDFIYFFGYESMSLSEWVSAFDQTAVEVETNEEFTLTLVGHSAMAWEDVQADPISDIEIFALNADGSVGESLGKSTDAEGKVTLSFDTAGTYYVTAKGTKADDYGNEGELAAPYCVVTVSEAEAANNAPTVKEGAATTASIDLGNAFTLDLSTVFEDADGDALTYTAKVGDAEAAATDAAYTYTPAAAGTVEIVFTATDGKSDAVSHTFTLEVAEAVKGTPVPVADNVIDITDRTIASWASRYYNTAKDITISGAVVDSATEDGTDIYILLDMNTAADAEVKATFGVSVGRGNVSQSGETIALVDGKGDLSVTLKSSGSSMNGSVTYTLHFSVIPVPTEPPVCIKSADSAELYQTQLIVFNLREYFKDATSYYVMNGEEKVAFDGYTYSLHATEAGEVDLVFGASNDIGECPDQVTITVNVLPAEGDAYLGIEKSNGSLDYVNFTTADNAPIEGLKAYLSGDKIYVDLPKDYPVNGSVKAAFTLTQTDGLPFITTKTGTSGTSSGKAVNNKFTEKTIALSSGAATFTFYLYNVNPSTNNNPYDTYQVILKVKNDVPALAEGQQATVTAEMTADDTYTVPLASLFVDGDGDALTYQLKVNGGNAQTVAPDENGNYVFSTDQAGDYTLVFTATDGKDTSRDAYTVNLKVANSAKTDSMTISVPSDLVPKFYVANGFGSDDVDVLGDELTATAGEAADGLTPYVVSYPANAENISVRAEGWGGMSIPVEKDGNATLRKVEAHNIDFAEKEVGATYTVTYDGHKAVSGEAGKYLLLVGKEYVYTAAPADTATYKSAAVTAVLQAGNDICEVTVKIPFNGPKTITVPTGATAQMFDYNKYYDFTELDVKATVDNGDGTTTYYFTSSSYDLSYRVSMEGYATKAGYWENKNITVTFDEDSPKADASSSGNAIIDNSVLVNVNGQNHLNLAVDGTHKLKAYRAWEIIKYSYQNEIISPDFHFNVLSGEDVISLTPTASPSNGNDDWMIVKGLKEGTAILEVTYDAMQVTGSSWDGVYGASDPARTGLVVVQVGGNKANVDFGIKSKASLGSLDYSSSTPKAWDAEFDTLYFFGESGELEFAPTADSAITEVAVSNDKGETWNTLSANENLYTANIVSGNNIIRVTTENGVAYQVVRGDQLTYTMTIVQEEGAETVDTVVDPGDTVRIVFDGLHTPIPKMAGNYNPGYKGNYDGDGSVHMAYTFEGNRVAGGKSQYTFETTANYIEVTVPEDTEETSFTLDNGYIAVGVMGLTAFVDGGDSHRNIPDAGCATRDSKTTWHTRSMLPDVTIRLGDLNFVNTAPEVVPDAVTEAEIMFGQKYAINPELLFTDKDGQNLIYTVSVNDGEAQPAAATYKFVPAGVGIFNLTFTANDGEDTTSHTIAVTVKENPNNPGNLDFGLEFDQIKGYVTVSFEDNALRVEGEKGLKFPEALGTIVEPTKVPYAEGDNVAAVTLRLLDAMGIGYSHSGTVESSFYLGAIKNFVVDDTPYASMAEFDAGVGSGWMITLNDVFITKGCSEFDVKDGDVVRWQYTCQLGADIGDPYQDFLHENVEKLIAAIGEVTLDSKAAIDAARAAYDELNAYQQSEVDNYETLTAAEARYAELVEKAEADQAAAADAESLIEAIGEVTLDSKSVIDAARAAYNALTDDQKALVKNYDVLTDAEATYAELKASADKVEADQSAADAVESLIAAIGTVTKDSKSAIDSARTAYNALTADQKALVENYKVLTDAEAKYAELTKPQEDPKPEVEVMDPSELPFTDVKVSDWFAEEVAYVYSYGLMNGISDTTFAPNDNLNRAMMATILYRIEGEPEVSAANPFTDVPAGQWYTNAIIWAAQNKIVEGYGDGIFKPTTNITREQMAAMMYRYAAYKDADMSASDDLAAFSDAAKVSGWAKEAMKWAVAEELINGMGDGTLAPQGNATRAQAATILMRFNENIL